MLHYIEDADENGYFDFQKPNGEVSRSFQSGKLIAVLLCAADAVDYYKYQLSLIDPSTESCCRQSLMISAINCSSRASELSCMINIVDQRQSSLSRSERPPFSYQVDNMFWWSICTHTHTLLTALCPGLPRWAGTRTIKPIWILLKQETVSGSGISWAICKCALRSRQINMPAPHHSVFYRPPSQQRQSTVGKSTEGNWLIWYWYALAKFSKSRVWERVSEGSTVILELPEFPFNTV